MDNSQNTQPPRQQEQPKFPEPTSMPPMPKKIGVDEPKPKKQGGFLVTFLSILLLLAVGAAGFFAYQTQNLVKQINELKTQPTATPEVSSTPTPDPTADWEVYDGDEFSFKYPKDWTLEGKRLFSPEKEIEIWISSSQDPLYNECMKLESSKEIKGLLVKSFSGVTTSEMCDPVNVDKREKWIVQSDSEELQPGIQYLYKKDNTQAETIFDDILSTFEFTVEIGLMPEASPSATPAN